ncbi:MAG: DNA polymerase IV [Candidatus Paceibacterota bacterium]
MEEEIIIGHIDMDAFFASVEELDHPWLSGLPIVVGSDPLGGEGRGVVSTANYKAREYGIHSALPIRKAWLLSQKAKKEGKLEAAFLTPRFRRYSEISEKVFSLLARFSPTILKVGSDEGYLDLSHTKDFKNAEKVARKIKRAIEKETGLTASIGIGGNKFIAKMASDFKKPSGLTVVKNEEAYAFLTPLSVRKIPGVGPKAEALLKRKGITRVEELQKLSYEELEVFMGKWGISLFQKVRGIGEEKLEEQEEAKSIGEHHTFSHDTKDMKFILEVVRDQTRSITRSMKSKKFKGFRTVVLTVRFSDFETKTKSLTFKDALSKEEELYMKAMKLVFPFFEKAGNPEGKAIRLIGLRIEKLI